MKKILFMGGLIAMLSGDSYAEKIPTIGVSAKQIMANFGDQVVFDSTYKMGNKLDVYSYKNTLGTLLINLIGKKTDLTRVGVITPRKFSSQNVAMTNLFMMTMVINNAAPACKDCSDWFTSAMQNDRPQNTKYVGPMRFTLITTPINYVLLISHRDSPVNIE